MARRYTVASSS